MSLINCPECNREISNKVKSCPHCGYPLVEESNSTQEPIKVNLTSINLNESNWGKVRKKVYKGLIFTIIMASIIASIVILKKIKDRNTYIGNLNKIYETAITGASEAEELCNLTTKVWRNTIYEDYDYETDKYTMSSSGSFYSDFNLALQKLYADQETRTKIDSIKANQNAISKIMVELKNPPTNELEKCYNTLNDFYSVYMGLTGLAINPSGNVQSFSQNKSEKVDKLMDYFRTYKLQIPERRRQD